MFGVIMVRIARREKLAQKGKMGCPTQLKYPLDTKKRVDNAMKRYRQKGTTKCKGFWPRWCKAAKRVKLTHYPTYQRQCRRS